MDGDIINKTKIFISNIPFDTTKEDLIKLCSPYGNIKVAEPLSKKGIAFVTFDSEESAAYAVFKLEGQMFYGGKIGVQFARLPKDEEKRKRLEAKQAAAEKKQNAKQTGAGDKKTPAGASATAASTSNGTTSSPSNGSPATEKKADDGWQQQKSKRPQKNNNNQQNGNAKNVQQQQQVASKDEAKDVKKTESRTPVGFNPLPKQTTPPATAPVVNKSVATNGTANGTSAPKSVPQQPVQQQQVSAPVVAQFEVILRNVNTKESEVIAHVGTEKNQVLSADKVKQFLQPLVASLSK